MAAGEVTAPRERGWLRLLLALAAFVLLPLFPDLHVTLPVDNTLLLLVPATAACFVAGWWRGGRLILALSWAVLVGWMLYQPAPAAGRPFYDVVRGWGLLAGASFGVVCMFDSARGFLPRALSALGITFVFAGMLFVIQNVSPVRIQQLVADQFTARTTLWSTVFERAAEVRAGQRPGGELLAPLSPAALQRSSRMAVPLFVALAALETLAAFALAWALYHRLSRARLGSRLAPLVSFRFPDQLVWALIVGLVLMLVPTLAPLKRVGENLVVFFGALYALRGLGVIGSLLWKSRGLRTAAYLWVALVLLAAPMSETPSATGVAAATLIGIALVGIADTWLDLRRFAGAGRVPPPS
jgi:hypothetical protein